jgi:AcrR family transcriptional regulator
MLQYVPRQRIGESTMQSIDLGFLGSEESRQHERSDAAANRRLILETAAALFEQFGVANVTMADIASAAGVGKGTLYRRFENKAVLALELMDSQLRDFQNETLAQFSEFSAEGLPYLAQLTYFLDSLVRFTELHLPLLCVAQSDGLVLEETEQARPYHWQYQTVSGLLLRAAEAGELPPAFDVGYTADALLAPVRADVFRFQREVRGFSVERISEGLTALAESLSRA